MTSWCFFYELAFFLWFFHLMMWTQGNPNQKPLYIWISFWGEIMYFHKAKLILWLDLGPCDRTKVNRLQKCPRLFLGRVSSSPISWNQPSDTFVTEVSLKHLHWRWHQPQRRTHLHRQQSKFPGFWEIIDSPMTFGMTSQFPILRTRNRVLELAPTGSKELAVHISSHLYTDWNRPCGNIYITEIGKPYTSGLLPCRESQHTTVPNGNENREQVTLSMSHSTVV